MSRYSFTPTIDSKRNVEVVVGWDSSFETFFYQIIDLDMKKATINDTKSSVIEELGQEVNAIPSVDILNIKVAPWTAIPNDIQMQLEEDKSKSAKPSKFQIEMRSLFE